ncbi:MAG TPA: hypothetical protein VMF31_01640 [Solirubrobacterales bacterium]|nr:hypothetical protein [Solirubrobacterales bacterium]
MTVRPRWTDAGLGSGMYESFYMRAVSPDAPVAVWIRHTVQKAPGKPPKASVWFTMFDADRGRPLARKANSESTGLSAPGGEWIAIGDSFMNQDRIEGRAGDAQWSLRVTDAERPLHHLPKSWMYRSPLPKTKPESPAPFAQFEGELEVDGRRYGLTGWPGMIGHNWGAEHAWTWIWLSGTGFAEDPGAWIDLALGRVKLAGRLTPWVANGAISVGGERHRLGGMLKRGVSVEAEPGDARMDLPGAAGTRVEIVATAPRASTVAWKYGSPSGHIHDVCNCSIAAMDLRFRDRDGMTERLSTGHGGIYELGLPEPQSWIEPEPIPDVW